MYTQCPECGSAFRVTAEVLKQAAGRVRCGGCGSAFNALDYLSEHKPVAPAPPPPEDEPAEPAPEPPRLEADEPPETISAERSAALLKTLDELAGSDIRIEDTGIEWRVVDTDDDDTPEEPDDDTGSMRWFIDDSPTPVDEQLSAEPGDIDAPEIFEPVENTAGTEQMRFDDDTPLPEDFDFESEPEEPASAAAIEVAEDAAEPDPAQVDLALGDPEDWEALLGEVDEDEREREREYDAEALSETEATVIASDDEDDEPLPDVDTQFATQAQAMGIDLSGVHAQAEAPGDDADEEPTIDDELIAAAFEAEARARNADEAELPDEDEDEEPDEFDLDVEEPDDLMEPRDRELVTRSRDDDTLAAELGLEEDDKPEHVVPPMTEEEQTINMMIDQDLLAFAVEDEDGFASTIVQKQRSAAGDVAPDSGEEQPADERPGRDGEEDGPLVETIIMEGEFVRDAFEEERLEEERRKSAEAEAGKAPATESGETEKDDKPAAKQPMDYRMVAGIVALALLLGAQYVHQSRASLAVHPAFSDSVGSVYRMLGKPVTPAWDITGWRFEATKGSTDESDEVLTIYSRIGNKSGEALPYPLINVSLTDRYEDIIGSKVLEPGDYLAESLDTREPVAPGETFSAVISIEAPDPNATGFKLNVCYRQAGGRLRCAIDDFK
ncbi:MAG TPA: DUF3426 domain-containing protein [Woeseiaceae bacterium]|nr:DUF3426 domain-containing protein [Woeseiaceae bacterium]